MYRDLHQVRENLKKIRCFALDLDGTIYLGNELFPFTVDFLQFLERSRRKYIFVTNNSSLSASDYYEKLCRMGVPVAENQVYTSGDATIRYLKRAGPEREIFLLGTEKLHADFERNGFSTRSDKPQYVVIGFDKTFNYEKLKIACQFIRSGVPFIATHPDLNCPMPDNIMLPDCGALSASIIAATGVEPKYIGKPNKEMIDGLLERVDVSPDELAIVGDRLSTDIKAGVLHNFFSILVLSGETKPDDLLSSAIKPDLVVSDLRELLGIFEASKKHGAIWVTI